MTNLFDMFHYMVSPNMDNTALSWCAGAVVVMMIWFMMRVFLMLLRSVIGK